MADSRSHLAGLLCLALSLFFTRVEPSYSAEDLKTQFSKNLAEETHGITPKEVSSEQLEMGKSTHVVFIDGILAELGEHNSWKFGPKDKFWMNTSTLINELGVAKVSFIFPSSFSSSHVDSAHLRDQLQSLYLKGNRRPLTLLGYSKGGLETLFTLLEYPDLVSSGIVEAAFLVQSPLKGAPIPNQLSRIRLLPGAVRQGMSRVSSEGGGKDLQERIRKLSPRDHELISNKLYYLPAHKRNSLTDGVVPLESQSLEGFGTRLEPILSNHGGLFVSGSMPNASELPRWVTRALFRSLHDAKVGLQRGKPESGPGSKIRLEQSKQSFFQAESNFIKTFETLESQGKTGTLLRVILAEYSHSENQESTTSENQAEILEFKKNFEKYLLKACDYQVERALARVASSIQDNGRPLDNAETQSLNETLVALFEQEREYVEARANEGQLRKVLGKYLRTVFLASHSLSQATGEPVNLDDFWIPGLGSSKKNILQGWKNSSAVQMSTVIESMLSEEIHELQNLETVRSQYAQPTQKNKCLDKLLGERAARCVREALVDRR